MAKLFNASGFLLLSAFLLVAEAFHHSHSNTDNHNSTDSIGFATKVKGFVLIKTADTGDGEHGAKEDNGSSGDSEDSANNASDGCNCGDDKFRDFMNKLGILYRNYASKELIPELKAMVNKLIDFTMNYLAKEKPDEVSKFHGFIESTAKVTGNAITKSGATDSE